MAVVTPGVETPGYAYEVPFGDYGKRCTSSATKTAVPKGLCMYSPGFQPRAGGPDGIAATSWDTLFNPRRAAG